MTQLDSSLWRNLHQQLGELANQLAQGDALDPQQQTSLLQARSQQWAKPPTESESQSLSVLAFTLGIKTYGVELACVDTVRPIKHMTELPGTPPYVRGIISLNGRMISVLDLRVLLNLPHQGLADRNHVVVMRGEEMEFGLLADRILGVSNLPYSQIQTEQAGLSGLQRNLIMGISNQQWTILDGPQMLTEPALCVDDID
ncbi:chemotaxis protein CheW [Chitinimonas sp. BJB300]|uniref:chemotaxis protein CheW n=1 Tax=Chitinimonas sp. BJB300 TaxID=1559339 RepID=UPI000C0FBFA8|nr:chemotaxis protein CheW [Chitinimonas sp. BJB300]PHV12853.1 chemotaxis protein CheW [Chitinimonas sp. BJB300]TSJ86115.1 purine-binding chemotaxis protein CheW [Chitinimonas sp. BJB300]